MANSVEMRSDCSYVLGGPRCLLTYLNAKVQPFSIHFFFHMDYMRLISWLYPGLLRIE